MISIIVPFRGGCPHRESAWAWLRPKLEAIGEVIEGNCPDGPWRKAVAVADGISRASGDRLVIHDADVWCDALTEAIDHPAQVVVPHHEVYRLTEQSTLRYMAGHSRIDLDERKHVGQAGGGILVLDRAVWDEVPMDPRFVGWGQEDQALAIALRTIFGPWVRLDGSHILYHLWHPPQERLDRATGSKASRELQLRYEAADGKPSAMRALLAEFTEETASCS